VMAMAGEAMASDLSAPIFEKIAPQTAALLSDPHEYDEIKSALVVHPIGDGAVEVVHEVVPPPRPIVIFGGNYDALPVARFAHALGWDVTLVERRPLLGASHAEFSQHARVLTGRANDALSRLPLTPRTAAVVMTHNYEEDRALLRGLIASSVRYIGMLGPRRRTDRLLGELAASGTVLDGAARARIHGPVGLDLGARAPEEIALSIIAEVQAVTADRSGRSLTEIVPARVGPKPEPQLLVTA
jgi:xanthine dehydrogenase accessory factor